MGRPGRLPRSTAHGGPCRPRRRLAAADALREGWTVAQVFQHAAGGQIGYAAALTGEPGPDFDPFDPSGEMEGVDPAAFLEDALARAAKAWAGVDEDMAEVPVPVPPHMSSPWSGSAACGLDAAVPRPPLEERPPGGLSDAGIQRVNQRVQGLCV
ncbi:hypothetical protein PV396_18005 [Streptomyces sp. ME02-8801-2C]|uniref:maleylpyruvate isomerase N-terminal domain-containing protein n=1 Tax=Streptomyces sp. ME02-8801-2C TaxID=3028680 RepID=UPI0029BA9780|nr:maleylpyruvate isomerase N-terminal domain-containing protein [Streptomyces sp. ME02-8801-2C]MDX3453820.1 hypothetical protein [Streptomyces sp. ME02-8801-2C]